MPWYEQRFTNMNVMSSFMVAVFCGSMLTTIYILVTQNYIYPHVYSGIKINVHSTRFSYMSKMLKQILENSPKQDIPESHKKPIIVPLKKNGHKTTRHKVSVKDVKDASFLKDIDIMNWKRPEFLHNYRNPCWRETTHQQTKCKSGVFSALKLREKIPLPVLRCLPYFFMVGQPRSGTTNIYERLIRHPDVVAPQVKDIFWIQRHRYKLKCSSVNTYLDLFHQAAQKIEKGRTNKKGGGSLKITGDASGDVMWDNTIWHELPGNENCEEPCLTNADYVHHLNPSAKIIVVLRDPVERVYSDYLAQSVWLKYEPDNEIFNERVIEQLYYIEQCLKRNHTLKYCVYNSNIHHENSPIRVGIGMYIVHLYDWYRVFEKDQIHVIHFETFIMNTKSEMEKLFKFLNLRKLNEDEMKNVLKRVFWNARTKFAEESDMWDETRTILRTFYSKYNQQLARLLNDTKYLWNLSEYHSSK